MRVVRGEMHSAGAGQGQENELTGFIYDREIHS